MIKKQSDKAGPSPEKYDFLWRLYNRTYFDTSIWLNLNYLSRDFLIINIDDEWVFYISKDERKKLSIYGLNFFNKRFSEYKKKVKNITLKANKFFSQNKKIKLSSLINTELKDYFLKTVKISLELWEHYWFTEYFLYDKIEKRIIASPQKYKKLRSKIEEMQKIKFELRKLVSWTVFRNENNVFDKYLGEIKNRTKIKNPYSFHYKELIDGLMGKVIFETKKKYYVIGKFNNWQPMIDGDAMNVIRIFEKPVKKQESISGQIANKGYYMGRVKIIRFDHAGNKVQREAAKLKKGEVLVTGSTIPQMMVACINAGAIVTEEGGIASHAAIISRELGKPCIIATKIATKIFKDGDIVEVDANKGTVRKIR